jgi:ABC-2 type transport system permease protein
MRRFLAFVKKETLHILRDTRTMLILLAVPILQILLFGFAISTEVRNARLAILDPSPGPASRRVVEALDASEHFDVVRMAHSPLQIDRAFRRGEIDLAVVFPHDFGKSLGRDGSARVQLIADATDPNTANLLTQYATAIVSSSAASGAARTPSWTIESRAKLLYNPRMKGAYNFVPGVLGMILLLVCAMMTAISIVRERETGTMEVLLVSPMPPFLVVLAKLVPYFLLSCANLASVLALSLLLLDVPVAGSVAALLSLSLAYVALGLALGLLISNIVSTQVAAMLVSGMAFMLPVLLLSGMVFPVESMPSVLRWLSTVVPARWYIAATRAVMIKGSGFAGIAQELGILLAMLAALIGACTATFRTRLD